MEYTYTGSILDVKFIKFEGKLISSGIAELTWDAVTDQQHEYFEVERSADGSNFISLGKAGPAPYKFIDASVQPGNNYYRIKQVNKDAKINYSTTIKIVYDPSKAVVTTYPNPVADLLNVRISSINKTQLTMVVTDIQGKVMYKHTEVYDAGTTNAKIEMKQMPAQVYILRILNDYNEAIVTQKILKLQ